MVSKDLNVCLLPLEIVWGDKIQNLTNLRNQISQLHPATDLLILPETFSTGFPTGKSREEAMELAESANGLTMSLISSLAQQHNIAICGTFIASEGGKCYNRAFFAEPNGDVTYADKHHLFSMAGEHNVFEYGSRRLSIRYRGWNIAMAVCYDIRFPVWCRNRNNEYDLLVIPANWPIARVSAWELLLRARAVENEAYVCGVDCSGTDNYGYGYNGLSMAVDFKGKDISKFPSTSISGESEKSGTPSLGFYGGYATLSRAKLDSFREKFPAWRDADRFELK